MGLNFYGYDFDLSQGNARSISSSDYLELLSTKQPKSIKWDEDNQVRGGRFKVYQGAA